MQTLETKYNFYCLIFFLGGGPRKCCDTQFHVRPELKTRGYKCGIPNPSTHML